MERRQSNHHNVEITLRVRISPTLSTSNCCEKDGGNTMPRFSAKM